MSEFRRFRVEVVGPDNAPRTINGKFAGGLPSPALRGRKGTVIGYAGLDSALVLLDGDEEPTSIKGGALVVLGWVS